MSSRVGKLYGKLRVLGDERRYGIRVALVECECGSKKYLRMALLVSGNTRSCGRRFCRVGSAKPLTRCPHPRRPTGLSWAQTLKLYNAVKRGSCSYADVGRPLGKAGTAVSRLYRRIESFGGYSKFKQAVIAEEASHDSTSSKKSK